MRVFVAVALTVASCCASAHNGGQGENAFGGSLGDNSPQAGAYSSSSPTVTTSAVGRGGRANVTIRNLQSVPNLPRGSTDGGGGTFAGYSPNLQMNQIAAECWRVAGGWSLGGGTPTGAGSIGHTAMKLWRWCEDEYVLNRIERAMALPIDPRTRAEFLQQYVAYIKHAPRYRKRLKSWGGDDPRVRANLMPVYLDNGRQDVRFNGTGTEVGYIPPAEQIPDTLRAKRRTWTKPHRVILQSTRPERGSIIVR